MLRKNALLITCAAASVPVMVWLGLYGFAWTDYQNEAAPALAQLTSGHLSAFLQQAPAYGGSLAIRAPFALLPGLWGGGSLAVYRMVAVPCLLAAAVFAVWLAGEMRGRGAPRLARAVAVAVCVANPLTLRALELGHPEDLLGAVLCASAVILALRNLPAAAGLALGLAVANKEWALLAAGPVLLALPARRALAMAVAGGVAAAILAPFVLARPGGVPQLAAAHSGVIFQPWQSWWFFGHHGHAVFGLFGVPKPGYRTPPGWIDGLAHPLIVLAAVPLSALAAWRRRADRGAAAQALLLLAVLMLLRCMLDPWDAVYYPLPFLFALLTWEALTRTGPPVFALLGSALCWVLFQELPGSVSADLQALAFNACAMPALILMAAELFGLRLVRRAAPRGRRVSRRAVAAS
ncbi:MAG: hypothetical protein NVSMB51_02620 [Solirubrobacteraceae bacterium]